MNGQLMETPGYLITKTEKVEILASFASKYSLSINCCNGKRITDGSSFSSVVLKIQDEDFQLGPGRILAEPEASGRTKKLVFTEKVYDLEALFLKKKTVKLQSSFSNLPLACYLAELVKNIMKEQSSSACRPIPPC